MRTCRECGVGLEDALARCPLCGTPVGGVVPAPAAGKEAEPVQAVPEPRVWWWLWEVVSLLALTAGAILFAIDLADGFRVTWSLYPLSAVVFLWACATSAIMLRRRPLALLAALTVAVLLFLFVLSVMTPGRPWFVPLGLPLVAVLLGVGAAVAATVRRLRLSLLPTLAAAVLGCGLAAVGVELVLGRYLGLLRIVSWSLVALACAISLFLALLLVHKRLTERHADIRRFFHL